MEKAQGAQFPGSVKCVYPTTLRQSNRSHRKNRMKTKSSGRRKELQPLPAEVRFSSLTTFRLRYPAANLVQLGRPAELALK